MPVDTQHPTYKRMLPTWRMCRDVAGGQRAMHDAGTLYLPKLSGETQKDYDARKARALFFNATWRTIAGLSGMLMRKPPTLKLSPLAEAMMSDVTQSGIPFANLAAKVVEECLTVGRVGVMVDYPPRNTALELTVAQVEAEGLRPKAALYQTEAILNWGVRWIRNKARLSKVVLQESVDIVDPLDEFTVTTEARWRVLDLAPPPAVKGEERPALAYRVRMFKKEKKADVLLSTDWPVMNGKLLEYIPFQFIGVDNTTPDVEEPPLVDLVYANWSHYLSTADIEHGAHKTALPQPYVTGLDTTPAATADNPGGYKKPVFYMGGSDLWTFPNPESEVGMLEYNGTGLEAIEKRLERKEKHMAVLGARMLEDQKKGVETAEVAGMHRSGEQATLSSQGNTASSGLRQILAWFDEWAGGPGGDTVECALNDEFLPTKMTPEELAGLVASWQSGALSPEELFHNMQTGGVIRETTDFETHSAQIENQAPRMSPVLPQPNPDDEPEGGPEKKPPPAAK
jgi:hypothetical protein